MTSATQTPPEPQASASARPTAADFDPEQYRMTLGEHLEELRMRLVLGLLGFVAALVVCLIFGTRVLSVFCQPLKDALQAHHINPQIFTSRPADGFMVFIEIAMISAAALAGPWMLYQLWQFIAAGLYPNERKAITRYVPLSISLLVAGMLFVYFLVLPWTLKFFIGFTINVPLFGQAPIDTRPPATGPAGAQVARFVDVYHGNPAQPQDYQLWFDAAQGRLKMFYNHEVRVIPFGAENLLTPHFTLPDYINLVLGMLIAFGLSFQLPLVVLALARLGIVEIPALKQWRKHVYFAMAIAAAVITPGDVITATLAMMVPLCLLYELGIFLATLAARPNAASP